MACSVALVAADLLAVYTPGLPPSVAMFGFMALVFTMRERVESSTEMVRPDGSLTDITDSVCSWGASYVQSQLSDVHERMSTTEHCAAQFSDYRRGGVLQWCIQTLAASSEAVADPFAQPHVAAGGTKCT